jgi:hypothetical protein
MRKRRKENKQKTKKILVKVQNKIAVNNTQKTEKNSKKENKKYVEERTKVK